MCLNTKTVTLRFYYRKRPGFVHITGALDARYNCLAFPLIAIISIRKCGRFIFYSAVSNWNCEICLITEKELIQHFGISEIDLLKQWSRCSGCCCCCRLVLSR